jgi:hypothetical protein
MKNNSNMISLRLRIFSLILFLAVFSLFGRAQAATTESGGNNETEKTAKDYKLDLYARIGFEYADNVFRLTDSQISSMETNSIEDRAGGRYKNMDSVSDYIVKPEIELKYKTDSPLGGKFGLSSWIKYNYYMKNEEKSYPEGGIKFKNSIWENGTLTLEGTFLSGFFKRNYLSDIDDASGDGNISRGERIYSSAIYDEYEGRLVYEHEIIKSKKDIISGLSIRPFAGYRSRIFNSTFSNRDQNIGIAGMGINFGFISRVDLEMIYQYEEVSCPGDKELILYNEYVSGTDENGDGLIKKNAPLETSIDRSSRRHVIEVNSKVKLTKDATWFVGYKNRSTSFTSDNELDVEHYNNHATRQEIKSGISYDFSKRWSAVFEYIRINDEDEEDGDYSQNNYLLTIKYRLL